MSSDPPMVSTTLSGLRILVVEDSTTNRMMISHMLRMSGAEVTEAATGLIGLEAALTNPPDCVVLDIRLPEMDGLGVLRQLRGHKTTIDLPIVTVTAYAMAGDRERFLAAGFDAYFSKPIAVKTFAHELRRVIENKRSAG